MLVKPSSVSVKPFSLLLSLSDQNQLKVIRTSGFLKPYRLTLALAQSH
jgi:hypothetical protein